ncbi:RING-H2 finger protein ATL74-like [Triticum urartu]|uniref:RING-type E3 ubiquitin transferase n=1 Tax=Triticum urartu TaxID=4572 RepID=A0A8R7PQN9_TRIUA|nr:RING-H2 finger protein ATL74-like [Triticum urartu]
MSGSTMAGAPATPEGAGDPYERQLNDSFTGRVALTVVFVLFGLTVAIVVMRVLLYVLVYRSGRGGGRGSGGLAAGIFRSINSFGRIGSRRHGLDASALSALPVTVHRKEAGSTSAAGADCAVCLSELADGDAVRQLPNCGHVFHVECVDAWLRTRTTCPLCRTEAELSQGRGDGKAEAAAQSSSSGTEPPQPTLLGAGGTLIVTVQGGFTDTQRDVRG